MTLNPVGCFAEKSEFVLTYEGPSLFIYFSCAGFVWTMCTLWTLCGSSEVFCTIQNDLVGSQRVQN